MPKKKETGGRPSAANARAGIVLEIMDDMAILIPPTESRKDGFEVVDHPLALKQLWLIANDFPTISVGAAFADDRAAWYPKFARAVRAKAAFRKNTAANDKVWARVQVNLKRLETLR